MTTPLFNVFEGTNSNALADITLSGELRDGRLTLNLTHLQVGHHRRVEPEPRNGRLRYGHADPHLDRNGAGHRSGSQFIVQILGALLKGSMAVVNIDFQADGNLTANALQLQPAERYDAGPERAEQISPVFVHSPLNAIKWYVKDGALYLVPNLNLMLKNDPSKAQLGPLDPGTITTVGIPALFQEGGRQDDRICQQGADRSGIRACSLPLSR